MTDSLFIKFDINYRHYHNELVLKTLKIKFSPNDRDKYKKKFVIMKLILMELDINLYLILLGNLFKFFS